VSLLRSVLTAQLSRPDSSTLAPQGGRIDPPGLALRVQSALRAAACWRLPNGGAAPDPVGGQARPPPPSRRYPPPIGRSVKGGALPRRRFAPPRWRRKRKSVSLRFMGFAHTQYRTTPIPSSMHTRYPAPPHWVTRQSSRHRLAVQSTGTPDPCTRIFQACLRKPQGGAQRRPRLQRR
jgi:hypothetical protein